MPPKAKTAVLIVGARTDPEAARIHRALTTLGARPVWCDAQAFPAEARLSLRDGVLLLGRQPHPVPRSVYLRSIESSALSPVHDDDLRTRPHGLLAQMDEKRAMLTSLLGSLAVGGARLVNSLEANAQHARKPLQLELLRAAGLPIPPYVATNDSVEVRRFARRVKRVVYKPLSGGATVQLLTSKDLTTDRLAALDLAPVLFQEYVEGVSVRAYVVGRRVAGAAAIHSPEVDYRRDEREVIPTTLTADERRAVKRAARACGMAFTGVDLIRAKDEFVVLECNPAPMFAVFEDKTGINIADPLAELLVRTTR